MIRNFIIAVAAAIGLSACATSTPYQPAGEKGGYGFSEQRIEESKYRITFRGNSSTSRETVENGLLYRAAELTIQNGFDHFIVLDSDTEESKRYSTTADPFFGTYYYGYPRRYYAFPYYAYGFGWGYPYDSYTREITRYSAVAFVAMGRGPKPSENPQAFDAREVMTNLRGSVLGPAAPSGS